MPGSAHGPTKAATTTAALALVVVAAVAGWAFTVILSPAPGVPTPDGYTLATSVEGDVGAHLTLNVAATWSLSPVGTNEAAGVVTTVDAQSGQLVDAGARLYSVNQQPVVAAQGAVPAYRSISGGDSGADVAQLQAMLTQLGFYAGPADGTAGASTVVAVRQWQQSVGVDATGELTLGAVIFVPTLPARLVLDASVVHRGATLAGGEAVVQWLGQSPVFTLPVSDTQSAMVGTDTRVLIDDGHGDTWQAVAAGRSEAQTGTVVIALAPADGAANADGGICGAQCEVVPVDGQTLFSARVVTVETVRGVVVPTAALQTDATQRVVVVDGAGTEHPVRVTAESQGLSVVTGIDAGLAVRVPADSATAPASAP
ncbi:hypothetical protein GCM10011399_28530 [Subtercola lobariae]|uniref:Peptidoglycan binding-like domain-containing protein n=2 Tax=Subtercola lobariae TaxID=1588641 RepID=A0A917F0U7_9MICO|nr:hypothetical protein GCM10011399_28530 [Subtercola lobariae]